MFSFSVNIMEIGCIWAQNQPGIVCTVVQPSARYLIALSSLSLITLSLDTLKKKKQKHTCSFQYHDFSSHLHIKCRKTITLLTASNLERWICCEMVTNYLVLLVCLFACKYVFYFFSKCFLNISRHGNSITFPSSQFQHLISLSEKKIALISKLTALSWHS